MASWGAQVAGRVNELCAMVPPGMLARDGAGGMGAAPLPANLRDRHARFHPFEVRFVADSEGGGSWMIWLPNSYGLLFVDNESIDLTQLLEPADEDGTTGWYVLDDVSYASVGVFLTLVVYNDTGDIVPSFSGGTGPAIEAGREAYATTWEIPVATIDAGGAVRQIVTSTIFLKINAYYV